MYQAENRSGFCGKRLRQDALLYHWRELPQVSFCRDKHVFVTTKYVFCRNKSMLVATNIILSRQVLSRQTYFCHDKLTFVATNTCSFDKSMLVATKNLSQVLLQTFCCDKHVFVATERFCCDKHNFVATKVLSRQAYLWQLPPVILLVALR